MVQQITRRSCLQFTAGFAISLPFAGRAKAEMYARHLAMPTAEILIGVVGTVTPLPAYNDMYYIRVVERYDSIAGEKEPVRQMLEDGVADLDQRSGGFLALSAPDQKQALDNLRGTPFFSFITNPALGVYNLPLVWRDIGYEGSAYEFGGYLDRGFDDIGWIATAEAAR